MHDCLDGNSSIEKTNSKINTHIYLRVLFEGKRDVSLVNPISDKRALMLCLLNISYQHFAEQVYYNIIPVVNALVEISYGRHSYCDRKR